METQISPNAQRPEELQPGVDPQLLADGGAGRVTIGEGGQFPTLKEAITTLRDRGEDRLCFCLLPGEHSLDGRMIVQEGMNVPRLHFSLEGVGPASVLALLNGGLTVSGRSVRLSNLALSLDATSTLRLGGSQDVVVEDCAIGIAKGNPLPVEIVQATDLHMARNRLFSGTGQEVFHLVLVIRAVAFRTTLVDNRIGGILSFYDLPGPSVIDAVPFRALLEPLRTGALDLGVGLLTNLLLARNRIGSLRISGNVMSRLQQGVRPEVNSLCGSACLTDNTFLLDGNQLVCAEATLSGNSIAKNGAGNPINLVIANAAYYVGNQGGILPSTQQHAVIVNVAPKTNSATRNDLNSITIVEP